MTNLRRLTALAALLAVTASAPAFADPPPWAGVWKNKSHHHRHHDDGEDVRVVYVPQFAAAPVPRAMPYGFGRGTCDRGLISSEMVGNVLGGVAGGLAGSQFGRGSGRTAATVGGTILGVMVGGSVGRTMDQLDQGCVAGALEHVPDRRAIAWAGDGGENYRLTPMRSYQNAGQYCREYQAVATIGGRKQQTYGTACRQPDGQWEIVD